MNWIKKKWVKRLLAVCLVLLALTAVCVVYLEDYYRADQARIQAFLSEYDVGYCQNEAGDVIVQPENADAGFIFYPGGKVEHTAYIPLAAALGAEGILCVVPQMPFRLAVFDMDAAKEIRQQFPEIEHWYIGGHSLGGAMAASHLSEHTEEYEGLILLGAYSTEDLSESERSVLSVYGSEDRVLDLKDYEEYKKNLPKDFAQVILDGGCHAYFGMYGEQDGDGTATIGNEQQIVMTAELIANMMGQR